MKKNKVNTSLSAAAPKMNLELTDMKILLIDGCRGIRFYSPEKIQLDTTCGSITVAGEKLLIGTAKTKKILITGNIDSISKKETT